MSGIRMSQESLIRKSVTHNICTLLETLDNEGVTNLYDLVIQEIEQGLLKATMRYTKGNQSTATTLLTMSRATLRKKLEHHNLLYYGKVDNTK